MYLYSPCICVCPTLEVLHISAKKRVVGYPLRLLDKLLVVKQTLYALNRLFRREQADLDPQCLEYTHTTNHHILSVVDENHDWRIT